MEHIQTRSDEEARVRLLETAKTMVLRGDNKFTVGSVCAEAGVDRDAFHEHFSGRTALMAAVMQDQRFAQAPAEAGSSEIAAKAEPASVVAAPDAWLERRLRVFERALNALE